MNETKLTAPQMTVLEALRNGATIERRTRRTTVLGEPCMTFTGRYLSHPDGSSTRINNHCNLLPALTTWDAEMKAANPEWRLIANFSTCKIHGSDVTRERGPYINRLDALIKMSARLRKQDHAHRCVLTVQFPNGMKLNIRNERGDSYGV